MEAGRSRGSGQRAGSLPQARACAHQEIVRGDPGHEVDPE